VFNRIINHLEIADEFERNALCVLKADAKSPGWTDTYFQCLGDASRVRAVARDLAVSTHNGSLTNDSSAERTGSDKQSGNIRDMTLGQLLRLAAVTRSAPAGSQRMRHAAERIGQVAMLLHTNKAMGLLFWWCGDLEPLPPGMPVIALDETGADDRNPGGSDPVPGDFMQAV